MDRDVDGNEDELSAASTRSTSRGEGMVTMAPTARKNLKKRMANKFGDPSPPPKKEEEAAKKQQAATVVEKPDCCRKPRTRPNATQCCRQRCMILSSRKT